TQVDQPIRSRLSRSTNRFCKRRVVRAAAPFLFAVSVSALLLAQAPAPQPPANLRIVSDTNPPPPSGSNPIAASRLPDGSTAAPNGAWASAGASITNRTTRCGSVVAAGSSVATVNSAIAGCAAGQYVELAAGSYTFAGSINMKNNVT